MRAIDGKLLALAIALLMVGAEALLPMPMVSATESSNQNPITAAPPVSRPPTQSCVVSLAQNQPFAKGYTPFIGSYAPPSGCPSPWAKVVLDWNGSVTGVQFDRIGAIWVGSAEIFRTSTPEPSRAGIIWHVAKDVSGYAALFSQPQSIAIIVSNSVSKQLNGTIDVTATLTFYEASAAYPAPSHAQEVVPLSSVGTPGFASPWFVITTGASGNATVTLPRNLIRADLEVYATPHSCDEAWYGNQTTGFALLNGLCGGTAFREIQVLIDGAIAGVVWPFPVVYTGGWNPYLWRPIPGVNAFDIPPYTVDLTPFVGILGDGLPHAISFRVLNDFNYWRVDGDLLLYTDGGSTTTSGSLTTYQVSAIPSERVVQTIDQFSQEVNTTTPFRCSPDLALACVFDTTATRTITLAGYVNSSLGSSTTKIQQTMSFTNHQEVNLAIGLEDLEGNETTLTMTTTTNSTGTTVVTALDSYPLSIISAYLTPTGGVNPTFILPAAVNQTIIQSTSSSVSGGKVFTSSLSDGVDAQAVWVGNTTSGATLRAMGETMEHYLYHDSGGDCFNHALTAAQGNLTSDVLGKC